MKASSVMCSRLFESEIRTQKSYKFENGHNVPLRNVMIKLKEYQDTLEEFVNGLNPKVSSPYVKARSYRNAESLATALDAAYKYQKILNHLVEHASDLMMTPRLEMIPAEKRAEFIKRYKEAYVVFAEGFKSVVLELEMMKSKNPEQWNNARIKDHMMHLHTLMGEYHNRF